MSSTDLSNLQSETIRPAEAEDPARPRSRLPTLHCASAASASVPVALPRGMAWAARRAADWLWPIALVIAVTLLSFIVARSSVDLAAIREAARQGTLDALAEKSGQPSGISNQPSVVSAQPTAIPSSSFIPPPSSLRAANRRGRADAPVTIVEFADFQCPYCGQFAKQTLPALLKDIDAGRVALVYQHAAILGDESTWAAEAAECAADQGQFWAYHDLLFAKQAGENQGAFAKDKLIGFAQDLKLDMTKFEPCLNQDQTADRVKADTQTGQSAGVRGTPTFFINGQPLVGAQPIEAFQAAIAQAMKP